MKYLLLPFWFIMVLILTCIFGVSFVIVWAWEFKKILKWRDVFHKYEFNIFGWRIKNKFDKNPYETFVRFLKFEDFKNIEDVSI